MSFELAEHPGSYRWYYVDVSTDEWSAVAIFMLGSLFSPRYMGTQKVVPERHAAVNFALYREGARVAWVLSEYDNATIEDGGRVLRIGASTIERTADGSVRATIEDRTPWWRSAVSAVVEVRPEVASAGPITLVPGLKHLWHPYAVRARGEVSVPTRKVRFTGAGYHDGNSGAQTLGTDLESWCWERTHGPAQSTVTFLPKGGPSWEVTTEGSEVRVREAKLAEQARRTTAWGLDVPAELQPGSRTRLLESSPFYARLEASSGGLHTIGESADFARFRSPFVKWMANFRTRVVTGDRT
jgi:carotenoid 1,2-hydratase